jgi:hypothetical protein
LTYSIALLRHVLTPELRDGSPGLLTSLLVTAVFGCGLLLASAVIANQKVTESSA